MAKGKKHIINIQDFSEWTHSLGFLFPSNEKELSRFDKYYQDYDHELNGEELDPENLLLSINSLAFNKEIDLKSEDEFTKNWKLVARNKGEINKDILDKMKSNQENKSTENDK